ncbi:MAG: DUF2285 domain-containing protein [Rhizobiales bacterium]|nr:DUF2285 domain-containing protein [Hyphomicrobiales bacterium]
MLLTAAPSILPANSNLFSVVQKTAARSDEQGVHFLHDPGNGQVLHLLRLAGVAGSEPLAALIPLDLDGLDRLEAVERLLKSLLGRAVPPDARLTKQQRRRARHMLQAVDGRMNGATYREIAGVIYGVSRVASDPWKSSALRDATMDLVKDALAMIAGGYRALLRHRRRS